MKVGTVVLASGKTEWGYHGRGQSQLIADKRCAIRQIGGGGEKQSGLLCLGWKILSVASVGLQIIDCCIWWLLSGYCSKEQRWEQRTKVRAWTNIHSPAFYSPCHSDILLKYMQENDLLLIWQHLILRQCCLNKYRNRNKIMTCCKSLYFLDMANVR